MDRRGRAGQIENLVNLYIQRVGNVVSEKFKIRVAQKVEDVSFAAGIEIIDTEYVLLIFKEPLAQMRPQKPCAAGDCTSFSKMHDFCPSKILE